MARKSVWLLSAGLVAISVPAHAQTAPETDTDDTSAVATQGATAEGAAVDDQALEAQPRDTGDIVVTATRRNEALSDVPLAVSAITADTLENSGASDIRQINQVSPSLLVSSTSSEAGAGVARIRGVGTVGDNPGLESSVALFVDGVYRSRTGVGLTELGQIERVEVLRGPQGTLFGRNASAGLISVITAKPRFDFLTYGQLDVGSYSLRRVELGATGPVSDSLAFRLDGVAVKRDGFIENSITGEDANDRNRWMVRAQGLYQPTEDISFRLIGDYAKRNESCCAAPYLPASDYVLGVGRQPSTVKPLLEALGAEINDDPFDRKASWTDGYAYQQHVKDGGLSGELVYDFGGAELTSITAYRYNKFSRGTDADYNNLDILHRAPDGGSYNRFKTFTQEARLQGTTFGGRLDWLAGLYFANEKLQVRDNIEYGADYERYGNCRVALGLLPTALNTAAPNCLNTTVLLQTAGQVNGAIAAYNAIAQIPVANRTPLQQATFLAIQAQLPVLLQQQPILNALTANPANVGFGSLVTYFGLQNGLNGAGLDDLYNQTSRNFALFTHNIFKLTDQLNLTVGARWTRERKTLSASFSDNNEVCRALAVSNLTAAQLPLTALQTFPCFSPAVPGGSFNPDDAKKTESKLSGTVVLSYKPTDDLLTYASFSRGYKAGGFNLDRAALTRQEISGNAGPVLPTATLDDLKFKPETVDAFELGMKYNGRGIDVNIAAFHQLFDNFQLNTFDGTKFIVANINSCKDDLNDLDIDNSSATGECTGGLRPGVRSRGVELEVFTRPATDLNFNFGATFADTRYRKNLVGANGAPLARALFQLPGRRMSNSSAFVGTASISYNPLIGSNGWRALAYADLRHQSKFNTGSDLDLEKVEDGYTVVNARIGIQGPDRMWSLELWAQNLFDEDYMQVAFDAFAQGDTGTTQRGVEQGFYGRSNQLFGAFLAEPRTFGVTLRGKWGGPTPSAPIYTPPPAPPPPAEVAPVVEQPAPPPPPPPAEGERG